MNFSFETAKFSDLLEASEVLGRAFFNYPPIRYIFPSDDLRRRKIQHFYYVLLKMRHDTGSVLVCRNEDRIVGVACHMDSKAADIPIWKMLTGGFLKIIFSSPLGSTLRGMKLSGFIDGARHRHAAPGDQYIAHVGVEPSYQGKGISGQLMRMIFKTAKEKGVGCYLETNTQKNVDIYKHLGFRVCEKAELGQGWEVYFMNRT